MLGSSDPDDESLTGNPLTGGSVSGGREASGSRGSVSGSGPAQSACGPTDPANKKALGVPLRFESTIEGCLTGESRNYYILTPPADAPAGGGYAQIEIRPSANMAVEVAASLADSNRDLKGFYTVNDGAKVFIAWWMDPTTSYRFELTDFAGVASGGVSNYTMLLHWVPSTDIYEPNQTRDTAAPIEVGVPVEAFATWGQADDDDAEKASADWYELNLKAGAVTLSLDRTAIDYFGEISLYDARGTALGGKYAPNRGASFTLETAVPAAGSYLVNIGHFADPTDTIHYGLTADVVPDHFTKPYRLTVTQ